MLPSMPGSYLRPDSGLNDPAHRTVCEYRNPISHAISVQMNKSDLRDECLAYGTVDDAFAFDEFAIVRMRASDVWRLILEWMFGPGRHPAGEARRAEAATAKAYAVAYAIFPDVFQGLTLGEVSTRIGKHATALTAHHRAFQERFGIDLEHTGPPLVCGVAQWFFAGNPFDLNAVKERVYAAAFVFDLLPFDMPEMIWTGASLDPLNVGRLAQEFENQFMSPCKGW